MFSLSLQLKIYSALLHCYCIWRYSVSEAYILGNTPASLFFNFHSIKISVIHMKPTNEDYRNIPVVTHHELRAWAAQGEISSLFLCTPFHAWLQRFVVWKWSRFGMLICRWFSIVCCRFPHCFVITIPKCVFETTGDCTNQFDNVSENWRKHSVGVLGRCRRHTHIRC